MECRLFAVTVASLVLALNAQKVCYGPLGCFSNDALFKSSLLRHPLLPQPRDVVDVTYALYIRHSEGDVSENFRAINISGPHRMSYDSRFGRKWRQSLLTTRQTKIIIHDYDDTSTSAWVFAMVEKFLVQDDCQVITVGWSSPGGAGEYYQATANARLVGAEIELLLNHIKEAKPAFEFESIHLIGHGMGAHIASYVGERMKIEDSACAVEEPEEEENDDSSSWWQLPSWLRSRREREETPPPKECPKLPQIGQITGLDPSGLWFEGVQPGARLDSTDAIFVDVIHTDVIKRLTSYFGHGIVKPSGNLDVYPNGGYNQPGCDEEISGLEGLSYPDATDPRRKMDCNHLRSIVYYLSSMDTDSCTMTSYPCTSWADYLDAKCTSCSPNLEDDEHSSSYSPSSWLSYLGVTRTRRTSAPECLKIGPGAISAWKDYEKRAAAAKTTVRNIKAFLKTGPTAPYCLKNVLIEVEYTEALSEGLLSFQFTDQTNQRTEFLKVGRVSNWGSTTTQSYLVTVDNNFGPITEITVLWEMGVTTSWWPGIGGNRQDVRRELRLPLQTIRIKHPPREEPSEFCSSRRRLRSNHKTHFAPCGTEDSQAGGEDQ